MENFKTLTFELGGLCFYPQGNEILLTHGKKVSFSLINDEPYSAKHSDRIWTQLGGVIKAMFQRLQKREAGRYLVECSYQPLGETSPPVTCSLFKATKQHQTLRIWDAVSHVDILTGKLMDSNFGGTHEARPFFEARLPKSFKAPSTYESYGLKQLRIDSKVNDKETLRKQIEETLTHIPKYVNPLSFPPIRTLYVRLSPETRRHQPLAHYKEEAHTVTLYTDETGDWDAHLPNTWLHEYWHHLQGCRRTYFRKKGDSKRDEYVTLITAFYQQLKSGETVTLIKETFQEYPVRLAYYLTHDELEARFFEWYVLYQEDKTVLSRIPHVDKFTRQEMDACLPLFEKIIELTQRCC